MCCRDQLWFDTRPTTVVVRVAAVPGLEQVLGE